MPNHRLVTLLAQHRAVDPYAGLKYYECIKKLFGASIIQYLPLWESSGANKILTDLSVKARNGLTVPDYATIAGATGMGDKDNTGASSKACYFASGDAGVDMINGNTLSSDWKWSAGTWLTWFKAKSGLAASGEYYNLCRFGVDANNYISVYKEGSINNALMTIYKKGASTLGAFYTYFPTTDWMMFGITWDVDKGVFAAINNGNFINSSSPLTSAITGTLGNATIGADGYSTPGYFEHSVVLNRTITQAEADKAVTLFKTPKTITILGDSIAHDSLGWTAIFYSKYHDGFYRVKNHSVSGASIVADMASQVTTAASDNADIIIVGLGTNDPDSSNVQTVATAQLAALKASNPRATIYWMGILPRTAPTDNGSVNNPRISAACAANSATYWDTRTTPWIVPASDLQDGVHPNMAGSDKIVAQVLARLP